MRVSEPQRRGIVGESAENDSDICVVKRHGNTFQVGNIMNKVL